MYKLSVSRLFSRLQLISENDWPQERILSFFLNNMQNYTMYYYSWSGRKPIKLMKEGLLEMDDKESFNLSFLS